MSECSKDGTTVSSIEFPRFAGYHIPLAPSAEQKRIAARIEKLFGEIEAGEQELEKAREALDTYRRAILKAAVTGELTKEWREKNSPGESSAELLARILKEKYYTREKGTVAKVGRMSAGAESRKLPDGWQWTSGEELFRWSSGKNLPVSRMKGGVYPVYGGNGVNGSHSKSLCAIPTIVIGRVGALCGNVHLTSGPAWITDNAIYASHTPVDIPLAYLRMAFEAVNLNTRAAGSGQPFVNQKMLDETLIALPPLQEQRVIVEKFEAQIVEAGQLSSDLAVSREAAVQLRQSILSAAFTGRLVPQDARDEHASALLTRFRGMKAQSARRLRRTLRDHTVDEGLVGGE